jgi:kynurenine 3-monooxygenase
MRLELADLDRGRLRFHDEERDAPVEVEAGVVFGADGAGSALREAFASDGSFEQSVDMLSHGYKELLIPAREDGGYRIDEHALHIWPRGDRMLMALPNRDGSFTVTLYLPMEGAGGFDGIREPRDVLRLFEELFPDAIPWIPDLERAWFENPTGTLGTVRCRPWHRDGRAVLIGDAAHAIVPFFGQGMNSGFEDCRVLDDLLDRHGDGNWPAVFPEVTRLRKPNADAIAAMALDNFEEMSDRVGDERFLLRKAVEHRLEEIAPRTYRSRYSMVMYSHIPFELCRRAGEVQQAILDELCAGLDRAADLDEARALAIVRERFTPFVEANGLSLEY